MATVNLSRGSTNVRQYYTGTHNGQYINFYCSYNNNGQLSVRLNVSLTSTYNWSTSNASAWVNFGVNSKEGAASFTGSSAVNKNQNQDFCTKKATYTAPTTITVYSYIQVYSGGWGPTASGGRYISFTISVPGIYTDCTAPTSFSINTTFAKPNSKATLNWSGAKGGTNNGIKRYYIQQSINNGSWTNANPYTLNSTNGTDSLNITLPNEPGATVKFRIRTEGAAGSSYYSGYKESSNSCTLWDLPVIPSWGTLAGQNISGNCYAYHNYGTTTIYWKEATVTANTFSITGYELWYSESSSSNGPWTDRQKLGYLVASAQKTNQVKKSDGSIETISSQVFSYNWTRGTVGRYYKFCAVAVTTGQEYYSAINQWGNIIQRQIDTTKLNPPTNFKPNIKEIEITQPITLSWTTPTDDGVYNNTITGYELYYSINNQVYTLINSNIGADQTSYNWTAPTISGKLQLRIRAKGSAGTNFYSDYIELDSPITIRQPAPPTAGTITVTYNPEAESEEYNSAYPEDSFIVSWQNFTSNTFYEDSNGTKYFVNPINSYSLYYRTKRPNGEYGDLILIANLDSSENSYNANSNNMQSLIWGNHYQFYIKAYGRYYGESEYAISEEVEREALAAKPPSAFQFLGSGYFIDKEQKYAIPGLKIAVMPIGASKAINYKVQYYIWKNGQDWNSIPDSSWITLSETLNLNEYTSFILIPTEIEEGDCLIFRALARNASGDETEYFPKTINEADQQKLILHSFEKENKDHPVVQIKRAYKDVWDREDTNENGIRLAEGELALEYLNNNTPLKMRVGDGKTKFKELPYLNFGSGIKTANFIIGTSTAGWTINDCDYLCDGIDDNVEINQAIQSLPDTGGEIIILSGTYNITNPVIIYKSNVVLKGNENSTKLIRSSTSAANLRILIVGNNHNNITIKDLSLDGTVNNSSSTRNYGIFVMNCDYFLLENVFLNGFKFSDTEEGIGVEIQQSDYVRINNCNIINTATCLSLYYVIDFKIENNIFVSSLKNTKSTLLFSLPPYSPSGDTYGIITNNSINCSGVGIQFNTIAGTTDGKVIISNNNFNTSVDYEPEGSGPFITASPNATNLIITGNTFKDNWTVSFVGILCNGDYWNISNNTFSDLDRASSISGSNNLFLNNTIKNCNFTCLCSGANNVISNNKITSNYSSSNISRSGENNFSLNNVFGDGRFDTQTTIQYPYLNMIPWYTGNTMSTYAFAKACPDHCNFVTTINKDHHFSDSPLGASIYGIMHVYCGSANYREFIIYRVGGANIYFGSMDGNGTAINWRQIIPTNI